MEEERKSLDAAEDRAFREMRECSACQTESRIPVWAARRCEQEAGVLACMADAVTDIMAMHDDEELVWGRGVGIWRGSWRGMLTLHRHKNDIPELNHEFNEINARA